MEGNHFASSSPAQQEDSWTCQRCGWVYPNVHPSAKHRRNHKKHCGKIKGFELQSGVHKGGSSDEASSDDGSHVNKESLPLQSAQTQHDSIRPVEAGNMVLVVEPPSPSQSRELPPPETNVSNIMKSETPVHTISGSVEVKPEVPPYRSTRNLDLTDFVKSESSAAEHVPNIGPCDKPSKTLGDGMDVKIEDLAGESTKIAASDIPEGHGYVGLVSGLGGVDVALRDSPGLFSNQIDHALERDSQVLVSGLGGVDVALRDSPGLFSNQIDHALERDSMHENAAPKHAGSMVSLDEPSMTIEEEGRVSLPSRVGEAEKDIEEPQVLDSDQSKETQKMKITTTPSIKRQGSSQEDDSWTCRRCGWVYPNPHPSAKHRRNHKKHCGKLKGFEAQTARTKGGSSDEVSSDEEKKDHIQHESSSMIQAQNPASGLTTTGTTTSSEDQCRDLSTSKEDSSAGGLPDESDYKSVTTSTEFSDIDARYAVSPAEENLEEQGQGKGAAAGDYTTKVPHNSDGREIFQTKEEIPSSQAIAPETQLNAVPSLALSEGLGYPDTSNDVANDVGSTSKVSDAPHELKGDSTPNVENSSVLNVLPSDAFPPLYVGFSKPAGDEIQPITHPRASGSANESFEAFGGTESHQDVHPNETTDEVEKLDLVKTRSLAGETLDRKFSSNLSPVLVAGNAPDEEAESLSVEGSSVNEIGLPLEALSTANITGLANDLESEKKFVNVQATSDPVELLPKDEVSGDIVGGPDFFVIEKMETPQVTEMHVQSLDNRTCVGEAADISGEAVSINDTPTLMAFSSESKMIPESVPLVSVEDTLATSAKDEVLGQIDGGLEETTTSGMEKAVERPRETEMPAQSLDNPGVGVSEERTVTDTLSDNRPTSTNIESKSEVIPVRGPPMLVGDTLATSTIVNMANDSDLSSSPRVSDSKQYLQPPALVGDTLATSTIVNMANDSGLSSSPRESDSKQSSLVKAGHKDKSAEVSGPLEVLEKPDIKHNTSYETDFESSDRSLDGTNSFTKAESEFSQRSEFASSSHKLSDSLEIFEDAPDTLEACSVGGSVEETESLDEPRQVADGVQEDSKLLRVASLDERVAGAQKPNGLNRATNELEEKPNVVIVGEASTEEKATTMPAGTSHAVHSEMEELKAPSPEAWQEPGPSTLKKEGKKMNTSEVMEEGKSSESHKALRSLMAMEGKDKMAQPIASPLVIADPLSSDEKEAPANGEKPKSRLKSFWSHCICCPAVH